MLNTLQEIGSFFHRKLGTSVYTNYFTLSISSGTVAKMTKGEPVSMTILMKICDKLDCDIGDLVHYVRPCEENDMDR